MMSHVYNFRDVLNDRAWKEVSHIFIVDRFPGKLRDILKYVFFKLICAKYVICILCDYDYFQLHLLESLI